MLKYTWEVKSFGFRTWKCQWTFPQFHYIADELGFLLFIFGWAFFLQGVFLSSYQCEWLNTLVWTCQKLPYQPLPRLDGRCEEPTWWVAGQGAGCWDSHPRDAHMTWGCICLLLGHWEHWGTLRPGPPMSTPGGVCKEGTHIPGRCACNSHCWEG